MRMKSLLAMLAVTTALTVPGLAMAREVTFTTNMRNYGGDGAYLAYYVTDAQGKYVGSLWMAGGKAKYYDHLSGWTREQRRCSSISTVPWPIFDRVRRMSARNRAVSAPSVSVAVPSPMAKPTALSPISVVEMPRASSVSEISG